MSGATIHLFINQHVFKKSLDFPHFLDLLPLLYLYSTGSKSCGLWFSNQIALCVYDIFELTCVKCLFILTAPVLYYNSILLCRFIIFFLFGISQLFVGLLFQIGACGWSSFTVSRKRAHFPLWPPVPCILYREHRLVRLNLFKKTRYG